MSDIKVVVNGILGKMGQAVLDATLNAPGITPIAGCDSSDAIKSDHIDTVSGRVPLFSDLELSLNNADVIVDFSNSEGARKVISMASQKKSIALLDLQALVKKIFLMPKN